MQRKAKEVPLITDARGRHLLTVGEAANEYGLTKRFVYRAVNEFGLPAVRVGKKLLLRPASVDRWLEERETSAAKGGSISQRFRVPAK